jgi:CheY-like chemotaxis protein
MPDESTAPADPRLRVLVADDHADLRRAVSLALESVGFEIEVCEDGKAALARLEQGGVDVLFTDVRMPGLDGFALVTRMRAAGIGIPVVMCSVVADRESRRRAEELGVAAFLEKPYPLDDLVEAVKRAADAG